MKNVEISDIKQVEISSVPEKLVTPPSIIVAIKRSVMTASTAIKPERNEKATDK